MTAIEGLKRDRLQRTSTLKKLNVQDGILKGNNLLFVFSSSVLPWLVILPWVILLQSITLFESLKIFALRCCDQLYIGLICLKLQGLPNIGFLQTANQLLLWDLFDDQTNPILNTTLRDPSGNQKLGELTPQLFDGFGTA